MNFFKNKFVIGCCCVVVSVALGGFVIPSLSERIMTDTVPVVVAEKDISKDAQITKDDLKVVRLHASDIMSDGYSSSAEDFTDKYASCFVQAGDILTPAKVSDNMDYGNDFIEEISKDINRFAVSVNVSGYSSIVGGNIRIGDIVTVLDAKGASYPELYYMQIINITDSSGVQISEITDKAPSTVTFAANIVQASKLAELSQNNSVYLLLSARYSVDEEYAESLLESQNRLFEENEYYRDLISERKFEFGE